MPSRFLGNLALEEASSLPGCHPLPREVGVTAQILQGRDIPGAGLAPGGILTRGVSIFRNLLHF